MLESLLSLYSCEKTDEFEVLDLDKVSNLSKYLIIFFLKSKLIL